MVFEGLTVVSVELLVRILCIFERVFVAALSVYVDLGLLQAICPIRSVPCSRISGFMEKCC